MHLGFQTMRTELKKTEAMLAKGNIPKPETVVPERREDDHRDRYYDRERERERDRDRGAGYHRGGPPRGGYRGSGGGYRGGRGRGGGGYRH